MATRTDSTPGTDLAIPGATAAGTFSLLRLGPKEVSEVMSVNLGGEQLRPFDLDRIKVPLGGLTTWQIPTLEGEVESKELTGIIVERKSVRSYWAQAFGTGEPNQPPDCHSDDSVMGHGDPGGPCGACPLSKFGPDSERPACRQTRMLFIILPTGTLPLVLSAPPTSLKSIQKYLLRLSSEGLPFYSVVTRFTLLKQTSRSGFPYSMITPNVAARLNPEQVEVMRLYAMQLEPLFQSAQPAMDDFTSDTFEGIDAQTF